VLKLTQELDVEALKKSWHVCMVMWYDWLVHFLEWHWKNCVTMQKN